MKKLVLLLMILVSMMSLNAQNDCSTAPILAIDGGLTCGTTNGANLESGECVVNYSGGSTEVSTWYRFNATNDSLIFAYNETNSSICGSHVSIYGPFTPGTGCVPACATQIYDENQVGDPGNHTLLTTLSVGSDYLVQIVGKHCNGSGTTPTTYCLGIFNEPTNNDAAGSSLISECGTVFNGTNSGYTAEDLVVGGDNLDGNAATTCPTCTAGDDVPYVVNNSSWFSFCATSAGDWSVDFNAISNCTNATTADGLQMTIFRGTPTNLTFIESAPSPSQPGSSWTSASFAVAAGECIYMIVDGFAGDQCDYGYTLNNLTTPCTLLPIELLYFKVEPLKVDNILTWSTVLERNNDYYTIERSADGVIFKEIGQVNGAGNSTETLVYEFEDNTRNKGLNYYKFKQTDYDGRYKYSKVIVVDNSSDLKEIFKITNVMGQEVDADYKGLRIIIYSDGTTKKVYINSL